MIRLCFLAILGFAATAAASPKVALPAIEGDVTGDMRDDVTAALDGDQLTLLGEKEVNRVYERLNLENLSELSEKQAKKLSSDLEADAVVTAVLAKSGKTKTLKFRVFVNGKKQKGFTVQFKNAKSNKFKSALRAKVVGRIKGDEEPAKTEAPPPVVATKEEDEGEGEVKRRKAVKSADDEEDPNPKAKKEKEKEKEAKPAEDEDEPKTKKAKKNTAAREDDEDEGETSLEKRLEPKHSANRFAARLDAGMSFGNRSLVFTNRANFPEGPKPFRSSPVPGARVEAEIYPYSFVNPDSILAGFGGAAMYDKTLVLKLQGGEKGVTVPVDQSAYSFGGRFRFVLGKRATSPAITAGLDYGRRRWKADRSNLTDKTTNNGLGSLDLPDTNYAYLAPMLGFRVPIGGFIALVADGEALFVSKAGPIQKSDMYGKARILGFSTSAGIDVVIMNRFAVRAQFEFTQFGYTFVEGGGELANSRDMMPGQDIGGAQDRSIGGSATFAVLY